MSSRSPFLDDELNFAFSPVVGLSGDEFHFAENQDGPARYNILHFKQTEQGVFEWVNVGEYVDGKLSLNTSAVQFRFDANRKANDELKAPISVCSLPCGKGQAKKFVEGEENCCFHCFK